MKIKLFPDQENFLKLKEKYNIIPVALEILADTETPVSLMQKLYQGENFCLLESMEGGKKWGRYSFLGIESHYNIKIFKNKIVFKNHETREVDHHNEPLDVLRDFMNQFKAPEIPGLPSFYGGLVGYFNYEMVSFIEKIPNRLADDEPVAEFMIPGKMIVFDNVEHTMTCIALAFIDEGDDYQTTLNKVNEMIDLIEKSKHRSLAEKEEEIQKFTCHTDEEAYRQKVKKVKEYIYEGDIIQAVISQSFSCPAPQDPTDIYRALRFINPSPYLFFVHLSGNTLIGSSPETMVKLEGRTACVRPIAGTRPRGKTDQEDCALADELLADEKEKAEHLMLVDLGRNDLSKIAENCSVQVTDLMFIERYSHVMHIVSNVTCDISPDKDAFDLFQATFPAGTLSGAPKIRAMEIIDEMEQDARGAYGGAVGYISFTGDMDLAITIRTATIKDDRLIVRAGAGIVADSDPETERIETVNKSMSVQNAVNFLNQKI